MTFSDFPGVNQTVRDIHQGASLCLHTGVVPRVLLSEDEKTETLCLA